MLETSLMENIEYIEAWLEVYPKYAGLSPHPVGIFLKAKWMTSRTIIMVS